MKKKQCIFWSFLVLFIYCSCSIQAQEAYPQDLAKAFADAGLPLLKQKITPQDFSLPILDPAVPLAPGATQSLSALKGKVVFLNFWATWCGPCRSEMPAMESLYNRYKDKGFDILAVNSGEKEQDVSAFIKNNRYTFPVVLDKDGTVIKSYGIRGIPTSYLIGKDGKIILRVTGSLDWDTPKIRAALEKLLAI